MLLFHIYYLIMFYACSCFFRMISPLQIFIMGFFSNVCVQGLVLLQEKAGSSNRSGFSSTSGTRDITDLRGYLVPSLKPFFCIILYECGLCVLVQKGIRARSFYLFSHSYTHIWVDHYLIYWVKHSLSAQVKFSCNTFFL